MWETYENKSFNTIKQDIKKEFKNIEDSKRWRYRDDQEIYEAWEKIISKYINQLSNADWMRVSNEKWWVKNGKAELIKSANLYKWEALKYFKDAKARFSRRWKEVLDEHWVFWMYITTSSQNEKQIHEVAKAINTAEETALQKIKKVCNPKQEQHNAVEDSSVVRDNQWNVRVNNWEIVRQKPLYTQSADWTLTLTDRTNPIKIHQALGNLFKDKDKVYRIDYSKCTNQKIKDKMQNTIWWLSCWIKYDKKLQTYVLTDKRWNVLSDRALVWEWVTLKQDTIMEGQADENGWLTDEERNSLDNLRSNSEPFEFDANNYRYYEQYSAKTGNSICSAYAYWVVSDILAKKWHCFTAPEVSAWEISSSSNIKWKFNIDKIDSNNPQQQIVNAPAWTFFTVKFDRTDHQNRWVSHVMVSLWNGVYTDLFGPKIRKIDFKSETKFSWNKFTYGRGSYTITEDSRLMSPNIWSFPEWAEQTLKWENVTPDEFAKQIHESTWANTNYIKSLIASQNNIPADKFWDKIDNLSVKIVTKQITDLDLDNNAWSNDVADEFLDSLKHYKREIMEHYPNLTNHEYDEIAKRAMWILYQESNAWDHWKYHAKESSLGALIIPILKWWDERSRWYTQIKFNQVFTQSDIDYLKSFDINDGNDLTDAWKCWIATMVWLIRKYYDYVVPMKTDSFRKNSTTITRVKYADGHIEDFARSKAVPIRWEKRNRVRTDEEFEAAKNALCDKHGTIQEIWEFRRPWITNPDKFFDFVYYAWNQPSQIVYWTATPIDNQYIVQSNWFINDNTTGNVSNA